MKAIISICVLLHLATAIIGQEVSSSSPSLSVGATGSTNKVVENVASSVGTNPPEIKSTKGPETVPPPVEKVVSKQTPSSTPQKPNKPQLWGGIFSGKEGSVIGTVLGFVPPFIRNQAVDLLNSIALNAPGSKAQGEAGSESAEQTKVAKEEDDEEQEENEGGDE